MMELPKFAATVIAKGKKIQTRLILGEIMGILIAIDGVDASGKQTQTELLKKRLENNELKIKSVSFPAYDNPSSTLVKMYLNGEFGDKPSDVNAYATSTFFAADRFATYINRLGKGLRKRYIDFGRQICVVKSYTSGKQNRKSRRKRQVFNVA